MKIYIAGKLQDKFERKELEEIDKLCRDLGFKTFLPHKEVGLARGIKDVKKIFEGDIIKGFREVNAVVALLNGLHVGAGTSWEIGYAYAKKIPIIGVKTDEPVDEAMDSLSAILIYSVDIVSSMNELKSKLLKLKSNLKV